MHKYLKILTIVVFLIVMLSILPAKNVLAETSIFSDVNESDWFYEHVSLLANNKLISGYPDGTFKPQNNIKVSEFIKITINALGYDAYKPGGYWAQGYIDKAKEIGILEIGEYDNYDKYITRGEMSKILVKSMEINNKLENLQDLQSIKDKIADFNEIDKSLQEYVLKAYAKGMLSGYPDGSFCADKYATRAEVSKIVVLFLKNINEEKPDTQDYSIMTATPTTKKPQPNLNIAPQYMKAIEDELIKKINAYRKENGLNSIEVKEKLREIAHKKSMYMYETGDFAHESKDGTTPKDLVSNFNYPFKGIGENIQMQVHSGHIAVDAELLFENWKNSPEHNKLMLSDIFTEGHVGVVFGVKNGEHKIYSTLILIVK